MRKKARNTIEKFHMFPRQAHIVVGLSGGAGSAAKRQALLKALELPEHLTSNGLLEALNVLFSLEELTDAVEQLEI